MTSHEKSDERRQPPGDPLAWEMAHHAAPEVLPRRFGRYTLLSVLGEGGMGKVYKAHDPHFEIAVAVKVPRPHILHQPLALERFYREARVLARLTHPHVCRVFDVNQVDGQHYLVLACIDGHPLGRSDAPSPQKAADLVYTLALTLAEVHAQSVIHRDLKPSNILIDGKGKPIILDFGLVLDVTAPQTRGDYGEVLGTFAYMAPEQARGLTDQVGPASDVYSLGVILYELLTGRRPFMGTTPEQLFWQIGDLNLRAPAPYHPDLDPQLEAICLRALAKPNAERYPNMDRFADALRDYLAGTALPERVPQARPSVLPSSEPTSIRTELSGPGGRPEADISTRKEMDAPTRPPTTTPWLRPLPLARESIQFEFEGHGAVAPRALAAQDRLYLDVGNGLRPGVIDHHHLPGQPASTTSLVLAHADHLAAAVKPWRRPGDPFTLTLHEDPDLDGLAAAYLAFTWLTTGSFPAAAEVLAQYTDAVDAGLTGMTPDHPFALYAAYAQLKHRLGLSAWTEREDLWRECVVSGMKVVDYVLREVSARGVAIADADAFQTPGLFSHLDRRELQSDADRYQRKLADPRCQARRASVRLPAVQGGTADVPALFVRDVQNDDDPDRCIFFKDWARADRQRCPGRGGFVALAVFRSEVLSQATRRCILSVRPNAGVTLHGLGALLDEAEANRRRAIHGVDDRVIDPATGNARDPRPGYGNADPWYDGRAHGYTIVDAPRSGMVLTAEAIEELFLRYGGGAIAAPLDR